MSTSALITMLCTWALILFFAIRFFSRVSRTPQEKKDPGFPPSL